MAIKNDNINYTALFGAVLGFAVFLVIYGIEPLIFTNDLFLVNGHIEKDIMQHYSGWLFYRNSPFAFPVTFGQNLAYPYGDSIVFTDSIPLFAFFFKCIGFLLPKTFQYFGLFNAICFALQGYFAAKLINLFTKNRILVLASVLFFVTSPIMLERSFRHSALTAHFLIIWALYEYFANKTKQTKNYLSYFIICALSITIHPYFLPFTYGIFFADVVDDIIKNKRFSARDLQLLYSLILTAFIGYIFGVFSLSASDASSVGYGFFSFNLNGFFNPSSKGDILWSRFLQVRPRLYMESEGFNYLGFGMLLLAPISILIALIKYNRNIFIQTKNSILKYFGLLITTLILTVFAISNKIIYGGLLITEIPLPKKFIRLASVFRSSGRFANLLFYLIFLFCIVTCLNASKKNLAVYILSFALAFQIYDISGAALYKRELVLHSDKFKTTQLKSEFWQAAIPMYDKYLYLGNRYMNIGAYDLAVQAGKLEHMVNIKFAVKTDEAKRSIYIEKRNKEILAGQYEAKELYFIDHIDDYRHLSSKETKLIYADGQWCLVHSFDKDVKMYENKDFVVVDQSVICANDYTELPYINGVMSEENVLMLKNNDFNRSFLVGKTLIFSATDEAKILKQTTDPDGIYLYLQPQSSIQSFAYPTPIYAK